MTDARRVFAAAFLSAALHAGVGATLRGVRLEGPPAPRDPSIFVDLVEPVVAMPAADRPARPAPRRPVASRPQVGPPPSPPAAVPVEARPAIAPAAGPAPPLDAPAPPAPPRTPPAIPPPLSVPVEFPAGVGARTGAVPGGLAAQPPGGGPPAPPVVARGDTGSAGVGVTHDTAATASGGAGSGSGPATVPGAPPPGERGDGVTGPVVLRATPGRGGTLPLEYESYVRAFRQRIQDRLHYPALAVRQGLAGMVELEVELDGAGRLTGVAAVGREAAALLRDAAVRAVRDATPFPLPPDVPARALTIRLPVVFELR